MILSVFVVLLLTVFYEVLKVCRLWLGSHSKLVQPESLCSLPHSCSALSEGHGETALNSRQSESSLTPIEMPPPTASTRN
ncbi:hypothetical protein LDENG_00037680, partial [Lucifuga dentata]